MSRSNLFFLAVAVGAIAMAFWYRQQVFQEKPIPTTPKLAFVTGGSGPIGSLPPKGHELRQSRWIVNWMLNCLRMTKAWISK